MEFPRYALSALILCGFYGMAASGQTPTIVGEYAETNKTIKLKFDATSDPGDPQGLGKTYHYTEADADEEIKVTLTGTANNSIESIAVSMFGSKPLVTFVISSIGLGTPLAVGSYPGAAGTTTTAFIGLGRLDANSTTCGSNQDDFKITALAYDCFVDNTSVPFILRPHLKALTFTFDKFCANAPSGAGLHGTFTFTDTAGVPCSGGDSGGGTPPPVTPPDAAVVLPDLLVGQTLLVTNGDSATFPLSIQTIDGFTSDLTLTATTDAEPGSDFTVSVTPSVIAAPGSGDATLTLNVGPNTFPRTYYVNVAATTNEDTPRVFSAGFLVSVDCQPPMILGLDQPKGSAVGQGDKVHVSVKPTGTEPFKYQWFLGHSGQTHFPIGDNSPTLTTPAISSPSEFWVRISNPCGSADSQTAVVTTQ